jgi:hypothetical protein
VHCKTLRSDSLSCSAGASGSSAAAQLPPPQRTADTRLGELFLRLLPGQLYYGLALLYPLVTAAAGVGAVWAPAAARALAALPLLQRAGPLAPLLHHVATTQPAATLLSVVVSLLTAYLAFVVMPAGDFLLGRDLRNPTEVGAAMLRVHGSRVPASTATLRKLIAL